MVVLLGIIYIISFVVFFLLVFFLLLLLDGFMFFFFFGWKEGFFLGVMFEVFGMLFLSIGLLMFVDGCCVFKLLILNY